MNTKILLSALLLANGVTHTHQLDAVSSVQYSIQRNSSATGMAAYDMTHGIVHYTEPDGSIKRYTHAHMARTAPWNAQQIFGMITVDLANELAGTWYIYR